MPAGTIVRSGPTDSVLDPDILADVYEIDVRRLHDGDRRVFAFGGGGSRMQVSY
jgi:ABC-type cobalamin/Fe3+-siderophores transport system ATPase subunit